MTGCVEPSLCHSFPYRFFFFFKFWFPTRPSSPPIFFFSPLGQIRLSRIPDIPAAYVRNSIQLLRARKIPPSFLSLYPSPIPRISARLHLVGLRRGRTQTPGPITFTSRLLFPFQLLSLSLFFFHERGSQSECHDGRRRDLETSFNTCSDGAKKKQEITHSRAHTQERPYRRDHVHSGRGSEDKE